MKFKRTIEEIEAKAAELGLTEKDVNDRIQVYYWMQDGAIDACEDMVSNCHIGIEECIDTIDAYMDVHKDMNDISEDKRVSVVRLSNKLLNIKLMLDEVSEIISDIKNPRT